PRRQASGVVSLQIAFIPSGSGHPTFSGFHLCGLSAFIAFALVTTCESPTHGRKIMKRPKIVGLSAITSLGLALLLGNAIGQQRSLKEQLVGAWTMVTCEAVQDDGTKGPLVTGSNPAGQYIFTENGYFSFQAAADLPKFASNSRMKTTPEENKAVVEGLIAYYGTYTVNDADKTFDLHLERSSFPN